jgi:hypothetical protein
MTRVVAFGLVLVSCGAIAGAQSLGDVARREEARRKTIVTPGKVYTNGSLRTDPTATPAPAPAAPAPTAAAAATPPPAAKPADEPKKDEAYWKQRLQTERDALGRAQTFAEALQSRINALSTDFVNRDDPFQRNQIAGDRQKALTELDRVKQEIQQHTKAIADIQEEGRKAGALAGWLR